MKKKHPFLYNVIRRSIVVILLAMMVLTAYNQSTGSLVSPEGFLAKIITPVQGFVSQASQNISSYLYRVKLRSNIEYEYNQLKAQNDELTLRSILYEELEQENAQLRALLGEYKTRSTMNPMLARVIASETGNYFSTFTINKGKKDGVDTQRVHQRPEMRTRILTRFGRRDKHFMDGHVHLFRIKQHIHLILVTLALRCQETEHQRAGETAKGRLRI